jgi:hypothetical protein
MGEFIKIDQNSNSLDQIGFQRKINKKTDSLNQTNFRHAVRCLIFVRPVCVERLSEFLLRSVSPITLRDTPIIVVRFTASTYDERQSDCMNRDIFCPETDELDVSSHFPKGVRVVRQFEVDLRLRPEDFLRTLKLVIEDLIILNNQLMYVL